MKVTLLNKVAFDGMARHAVHAALICTGNEARLDDTNVRSFLSEIIKKGHESILEHINLTFRIEGISRALLQELSRHRHISLSVQSTRSTLKKTLTSPVKAQHLLGDLGRVLLSAAEALPETIERTARNLDNARCVFAALDHASDIFQELMRMDGEADGFVPDYIKYLIPECMPTNLVMTVNVRELRHIFSLRSRPEALLEFRRLVAHLYKAIPEGWEHLFTNVLHSAVFDNLDTLTTVPDVEEDDEDEE